DTPVCAGSVCVCDATSCGPGAWCDGKQCVSCGASDPNHCGPSCLACSGATPVCAGGQCVCDAASCGPGFQCVGGGCVKCDTVAACGPACQPCGGDTPYCAPDGSTCGQCLS